MATEGSRRISIDSAKIKTAVEKGIPLSILTYTLPHEMEVYMGEALTVFLRELGQEHMTEFLIYCLNELVINAKKANTKRVYFKEKNLAINDPADYAEGMKTFKADTLGNISRYLKLQKEQGLYVKLILQARNNKIKVEVRNNAELTFFEYKRIHDKLSRARQCSSAEEAFASILDDSEGAGLGLVILILILKKIGLTEENFRVLCENGETITRIVLPLNEKQAKDISDLSRELAGFIETLPQFPEHILALNRLLDDPCPKLSGIARFIASDAALSACLLKLANSAAVGQAPCGNIIEAVKMTGVRGIRNLLNSLGSIQGIGESSPDAARLWAHANRTAFNTYNLSRNYFPDDSGFAEDSYSCGLLHDIGKIALESADKDMFNKMSEMCETKGIPFALLETLSGGINHAEVGARIAENWNFPDMIAAVIRYHHEPDMAPDEFRKLAQTVYFADMLCYYQEGSVEFYHFDDDALKLFKITGEAQLKALSHKLDQAFKQNAARPVIS
jgi:putative nucleotidyltransferase with HDIG domain